MTKVFDKTDKGREEIATRKHHLSSRLRALLVMVDGKHSAEDLLQKVAGLGLTEESLTELLDQGFIQNTASLSTATHAAPASMPVPQPTAAPPAPPPTDLSVSDQLLEDGQSQFEAIYRFYTETIKSTIGLRGYGLQLKVEKSASVEDFRQLRQPYLEAVLKAQGPEMARSLRTRLDQLLYLNETPPPLTTIIGLSS